MPKPNNSKLRRYIKKNLIQGDSKIIALDNDISETTVSRVLQGKTTSARVLLLLKEQAERNIQARKVMIERLNLKPDAHHI